MSDPTNAAQARSAPHAPSLAELARPILLSWERLRVLYLAILAPASLAMAWLLPLEPSNEVTLTLIVGGVFANVCFMAGPALEIYVCWLGREFRWLRGLLFWSGTLLTLLLAFLTLAGLGMPSI